MIKTVKLSVLILLVLLLVFSSCKEKVFTPEVSSTGALVNYQGCKESFDGVTAQGTALDSTKECIHYEYDENGVLRLNHINAGFNCCPGEIFADITVTGNMIFIEEHEKEEGCFCRCLFDVDYEFLSILPGEYTIIVKGPYTSDESMVMEFTVDLYPPISGTFCVDRADYPWGT